MKTIGFADRNWSFKEAVRRQIEVENRVVFSKQPAQIIYDYRPTTLKLTEAAKEAIAKGIHFVNALRKL